MTNAIKTLSTTRAATEAKRVLIVGSITASEVKILAGVFGVLASVTLAGGAASQAKNLKTNRLVQGGDVEAVCREAREKPKFYDLILVIRPSIPATVAGYSGVAVLAEAVKMALSDSGITAVIGGPRELRATLREVKTTDEGGETLSFCTQEIRADCPCRRR